MVFRLNIIHFLLLFLASIATTGLALGDDPNEPLVCQNSCYFRKSVLESGGPLGLIENYEVSKDPLAGFTPFQLGSNAPSCSSSCFAVSRPSSSGETVQILHSVVDSSGVNPGCENPRCYEPSWPSQQCQPRFEYVSGAVPKGREVSLAGQLGNSNCGYKESLKRETQSQCFDTFQLNIRGAGTVSTNGKIICQNNENKEKACFPLLANNLIATASKDWAFTQWEATGVSVAPNIRSANINTANRPEGPRILTAVFQPLPANFIKVYKIVLNRKTSSEPDAAIKNLEDRNYILDSSRSVCSASGYQFCSVKSGTVLTAVPNEPIHTFKGWFKPGKTNILISRAPRVTTDSKKDKVILAVFEELSPVQELPVTVSGSGEGRIISTPPAFFTSDTENENLMKDCVKKGEDVKCRAHWYSDDGLFTLALTQPSFFVGWKWEGVSAPSKCRGINPVCDLRGVALPEGAALTAVIEKPVTLTIEVVNGGEVFYSSPPIQQPNGVFLTDAGGGRCRLSCAIQVTNPKGEINRLFSAWQEGGKVFRGWRLLNEKNEDITGTLGSLANGRPRCPADGGVYQQCDLSTVKILNGYTLRATWTPVPSTTIPPWTSSSVTSSSVTSTTLPTQANTRCVFTSRFNIVTRNVELSSNMTGIYKVGDTPQLGVSITAGVRTDHPVVQQTYSYPLNFNLYALASDSTPKCSTALYIPALSPSSVTSTTMPTSSNNSVNVGGGGNCNISQVWTPACKQYKLSCSGFDYCVDKPTCVCAPSINLNGR